MAKTDPKKKNYTIKAKSGGKNEVSGKSVKDAKAGKGKFKERTAYKGKAHKTESGKIYGTSNHAGVFTRTTSPAARRRAKKELQKDRAIHKQDSTAHSSRIKRFQAGRKKGY